MSSPKRSLAQVTLVLDACVGLKLVIHEDGSDKVAELARRHKLMAPEFFWLECANVLAGMVRGQLLSPADGKEAFFDLRDQCRIDRCGNALELTSKAFMIAEEMKHPIYDCLYLATAVLHKAVCVTTDRKFLNVVKNFPQFTGFIVDLNDIDLSHPIPKPSISA